MNEPKASVREIRHEVRVNLADAQPLKTFTGRRRKPVGLRIQYGIRADISRVDVTVEFHDAAETFPPVMEMPGWMREIVDANRPADVDSPWEDRRTGTTGWDLAAPTVPDGDVPGIHDPAALHDVAVRGLRALGFTAEDAQRYADAHQRDALDVAADAILDEAWPHEKPDAVNEELYRLADKVRAVRLPRATDH